MLLIFCLIFCQLQPGVAYKSGAYKNKCVYHSGYNYLTIEGIANYLLQRVLYGSAFKIMNYDSFTFYHLLRPFDIDLTPDDSKVVADNEKLNSGTNISTLNHFNKKLIMDLASDVF